MATRIKGAKSKEISTAEPAPEVAASEQPQMIEAATQSGEQEASLHGWNEDEADALEAALGEADAEAVKLLAREHPNVVVHFEGRDLVTEIVVPGKLVNLVVR